MPGSCDSEGSSSPSLIPSLRNFRFQSKPKYSASPLSIPKGNSSFSASPVQQNSSPLSSTQGSVIPETPPSQLSKTIPVSLNQTTNLREGSYGDIKVVSYIRRVSDEQENVQKSSNVSPCASTPSDLSQEQCKSNNSEAAKQMVMDEYEVFCDKEQKLKTMLKQFPGVDIMEAQDLLVSCRWDLKTACEQAQKLPIRATAKRKSSNADSESNLSKGVVFSNKMGDNSKSSNCSDEIVLDGSDESDSGIKKKAVSNGPLSLNAFKCQSKQKSLKNSLTKNLKGPPQKKYRKIVQVCSDSDEDDPAFQVSANTELPSANIQRSSRTYSRANAQNKVEPSSSVNNNASPTREVEQDISVVSVSTDINKKKSADVETPLKAKGSKKKKRRLDSDEEYDDYIDDKVYSSDDSDSGETLTPARSSVLKFFQDSSIEELATVPGCSKKKAEVIMKYRPFSNWSDLVSKLDNDRFLSTDMLNGAKKVMDMRAAVNRLMNKCQRIALDMEDLVENLKENTENCTGYVSKQPELLNAKMHLTNYQMLGLNWLLLMHSQNVNAILADEMGLGKTIQAIAFLAYLKEQGVNGPHLIVAPSSVLDNWQKELKLWWPTVSILCYHGSQDSRRLLRVQIMNDEVEEFDVMVTTYNMVASSGEDRSFFKRLDFHYVIFDEAHMLKNISSQRYQHLMRLQATRRLLLTGTPLQNNLVELMSLLIFAMPHMFRGKTEHVLQMFSSACKSDESRSKFEKERIEHAKRIMKPFVLRRLKREVLKDLPTKHEEIKYCPMLEEQEKLYGQLVATFSEEVKGNSEEQTSTSGCGMMMQLRKAANHPLLVRTHYDDDKLVEMSKILAKDSEYKDEDADIIFEDIAPLSDFQIHQMCENYTSLLYYRLSDDKILYSGKFAALDALLPDIFAKNFRILLFSQFTMILDIIEEYMRIRNHEYCRLDGQVPVAERQQLVEEFNENNDIKIFLLSTRAGGIGINLASANVVLIHDIDFNPYNDKQAEDRCHRVGQEREVFVYRMISKNTIEEGMLQRAKDKLKLEKEMTAEDGDEEKDSGSVAKLLRDALGLSTAKNS